MQATMKILGVAVAAFAITFAVTAANIAADRGAAALRDAEAQGEMLPSRSVTRHAARASAYGPGLYGNTMACGGTLNRGTVAVAHKSLPCGALVQICFDRTCTTIPVRDRGPYVGGRSFDMTEGATRRYGYPSARDWGVKSIRWRCVRRCS